MALVGAVGTASYFVGIRAAKPPPAPAVAAPAPLSNPVVSPPKPVNLEGEELVKAVRAYVGLVAVKLFRTGESAGEVKVLDIDVRAAQPDRRKIPWLWESTIMFTVANQTPQSERYSMKMLSQVTPEMKGGDCWREITHLKSGVEKRFHLDQSEWTDSFRDHVREEWDETHQKWNDFRSERRMTEEYAYAKLGEMKSKLAERLRLSEVELTEILNASHAQ